MVTTQKIKEVIIANKIRIGIIILLILGGLGVGLYFLITSLQKSSDSDSNPAEAAETSADVYYYDIAAGACIQSDGTTALPAGAQTYTTLSDCEDVNS